MKGVAGTEVSATLIGMLRGSGGAILPYSLLYFLTIQKPESRRWGLVVIAVANTIAIILDVSSLLLNEYELSYAMIDLPVEVCSLIAISLVWVKMKKKPGYMSHSGGPLEFNPGDGPEDNYPETTDEQPGNPDPQSVREFPYPSSRRFTFDVGRIGREKHHVRALLEVDVSEARKMIYELRRTGKNISFIAWLIKVIADCVALHPPVNGINRARQNKVMAFSDVDISLVIEKEVGGTRVPLPYVIRQADQKTPGEITEEIEIAKKQDFEDEGDYVLGKKRNPLSMRLFASLPQSLRLFLMRTFVLRKPHRLKTMMGTVMVTTAGMAGDGKAWILPFSMHPLSVAFGSINKQPVANRGEIIIREILHLTVAVDHDVIDGVPAGKFVNDMAGKMGNAYGL